MFEIVSALTPGQVEYLADLHSAVLPSLLAELGRPFLLRYYQLAQADPLVICKCALDGNTRQVLGWALGSPQPVALNARLRRPWMWFLSELLKTFLRQPALVRELLISAFFPPAGFDLRPGDLELTYIGVSPQSRGQGVGRALLNAFIEAARQANYRTVILSVETDNLPAIRLYTQAGFSIAKTFHEGRFHRHRMELQINAEG